MTAQLQTLLTRYPQLLSCRADIEKAEAMMLETYRRGGKILLCGNGGSAADCNHIAGELLKGFLEKRPMTDTQASAFRAALGDRADAHIVSLQRGIPVISLPSQSAVLTAFANDVDAEMMFAQLVFAYAASNDLLIAISTSGDSKNVVRAAEAAKALGIRSLALTGAKESKLSALCDCTVRVPETETYKVQEMHLPIYHELCAAMEAALFGEE